MHEPGTTGPPHQQAPFAEVYELHAPGVYRYCVLQVGEPATAEDLTAEVFIAAYQRYDTAPADPEMVRRWLFRIAKNDIIDHWRKARRWQALFGRMGREQRAHSESVESVVAINDEIRRLLDTMKGLSARDRTLIGLRAGAGLSDAEIGKLVGLSENAASQAVRRAFSRLRRLAEERS